jgi:hypothetical protein
MSFAHSPKIVTDGLVLSLDAGNTKSYVSGSTTWFDKSGFSNNGTLTNGPTFNTGSGGSIVFDGVDDYVALGSSVNSFMRTNLPITLEAFVFINTSSNNETIIGNTWASTGLMIRKTSTNTIRFILVENGSNYRGKDSPTITTGWYHTVGTYNGNDINDLNNINVYINSSNLNSSGIFEGTVTTITPIRNTNIGTTGDNTNLAFLNGKVAIARIYNRALSQAEITQNYNAQKGRYGL